VSNNTTNNILIKIWGFDFQKTLWVICADMTSRKMNYGEKNYRYYCCWVNIEEEWVRGAGTKMNQTNSPKLKLQVVEIYVTHTSPHFQYHPAIVQNDSKIIIVRFRGRKESKRSFLTLLLTNSYRRRKRRHFYLIH
jgi:hypothetical protein